MRDSLQLPGSCREGTPLLIHVCFSVSTLYPLRFPGRVDCPERIAT